MLVVIVAGETSGDMLGAGLIRELKALGKDVKFAGIGGPKMIAEGFDSLFPMERLSVMGLVEPLKRLPELLKIRQTIKDYCVNEHASMFIGIDSPDFNLPIEKFLRQKNIKTVHYVSPSVWAWRQGRVKLIRQAVDRMLTLFPFEADFYQHHDVPVTFVGHPLADEISMSVDTLEARDSLGVPRDKTVVALMPGSRGGEVKLLGPLFLHVACEINKSMPGCIFLLPAASVERKKQIENLVSEMNPELHNVDLRVFDGQSHQAMSASDVVLLASGTTALEAMLLKKPMLVAYKLAPLSYQVISRMMKTPYMALPNLLANRQLVSEYKQHEASLEALVDELTKLITDENYREQQTSAFSALHESLRCNASRSAAMAVHQLLLEETGV